MLIKLLPLALLVTSFLDAQSATPKRQMGSHHAQTLVEAIRINESGVVQISVDLGAGQRSSGTGFRVSDQGYYITALHVVRDGSGHVFHDATVSIPLSPIQGRGFTMLASMVDSKAIVIDQDVDHDLALLKVEGRPHTPTMNIVGQGSQPLAKEKPMTLSVCTHRYDAGSQVFTIGFPLTNTTRVSAVGIVASSVPTEVDSHMQIRDSYLVDMQINHGNSGGPVISAEDGCVVGLVDASQNAGLDYILPNQPAQQGAVGLYPNGRDQNGSTTYGAAAIVGFSGIGVLIPSEYIAALMAKNSVTNK